MKIILLFLTFALTIFLKINAQNNPCCNQYAKTINVTGSAEMEFIPDEIYVQIGLTEYKKRGEEKVELDKIKSQFLQQCKEIGIEDSLISIGSMFGYNPSQYWYRKNKKNQDLLNSLVFQIKFSDSKKIQQLANVLDDDATSSFVIARTTHSKINEFRRDLKIKAIKAAKEKAVYLSDAINEKVGEAISIKEPNEKNTDYLERNEEAPGSNSVSIFIADSKTDGTPYKKKKIRYEVEVVFALK